MSAGIQQRSYLSYVPLRTPALQQYNRYDVDNQLLLRRAAIVATAVLAVFPLIYLTAAKVAAGFAGACLMGIGISMLDWVITNVKANRNAFESIIRGSGRSVNCHALQRMKGDIELFDNVVKHGSNWQNFVADRNGIEENVWSPLPNLKIYKKYMDRKKFQDYYLDYTYLHIDERLKRFDDLLFNPDYLDHVIAKGFLTKESFGAYQSAYLLRLIDLRVDLDRVVDLFVVHWNFDLTEDHSIVNRLLKLQTDLPKNTSLNRIDELIKRFK